MHLIQVHVVIASEANTQSERLRYAPTEYFSSATAARPNLSSWDAFVQEWTYRRIAIPISMISNRNVQVQSSLMDLITSQYFPADTAVKHSLVQTGDGFDFPSTLTWTQLLQEEPTSSSLVLRFFLTMSSARDSAFAAPSCALLRNTQPKNVQIGVELSPPHSPVVRKRKLPENQIVCRVKMGRREQLENDVNDSEQDVPENVSGNEQSTLEVEQQVPGASPATSEPQATKVPSVHSPMDDKVTEDLAETIESVSTVTEMASEDTEDTTASPSVTDDETDAESDQQLVAKPLMLNFPEPSSDEEDDSYSAPVNIRCVEDAAQDDIAHSETEKEEAFTEASAAEPEVMVDAPVVTENKTLESESAAEEPMVDVLNTKTIPESDKVPQTTMKADSPEELPKDEEQHDAFSDASSLSSDTSSDDTTSDASSDTDDASSDGNEDEKPVTKDDPSSNSQPHEQPAFAESLEKLPSLADLLPTSSPVRMAPLTSVEKLDNTSSSSSSDSESSDSTGSSESDNSSDDQCAEKKKPKGPRLRIAKSKLDRSKNQSGLNALIDDAPKPKQRRSRGGKQVVSKATLMTPGQFSWQSTDGIPVLRMPLTPTSVSSKKEVKVPRKIKTPAPSKPPKKSKKVDNIDAVLKDHSLWNDEHD